MAAINRTCFCFYNMSLRLRSSVYGGVPEWPKGTDCKSAAYSFGGSNPPSPTNKNPPASLVGFYWWGKMRVDSNPLKSNMPVACWQNQCKHWFSPYRFPSESGPSNPPSQYPSITFCIRSFRYSATLYWNSDSAELLYSVHFQP